MGEVITGALILISMIGLIWCLFGIPAGIVMIVLKSLHKVSLSWKQILIFFFGGIGLLIITFLLFFISSVIAAFLGYSLTDVTLPKIPEK